VPSSVWPSSVSFYQVLSNANTMIQLASAEEMRGRCNGASGVSDDRSTPSADLLSLRREHFGASGVSLSVGGRDTHSRLRHLYQNQD